MVFLITQDEAGFIKIALNHGKLLCICKNEYPLESRLAWCVPGIKNIRNPATALVVVTTIGESHRLFMHSIVGLTI
ncbi:hypothetical protein XELAEV_18022155mg [Xenopus laevis]|uniref:Uncharacterized protein n=1 Tax=Xenopus laevis TaxID=8355 RepID=A0A974D4J5_XENLA|nr:hypothetical protein XELAEV_18022155mg [Xenopus laevis]